MSKMDSVTKLRLLKQNLQLLTDSNDDFLRTLLKQAESLMSREGIKDDESTDYHLCIVDYAAFLFRKRNGDMQMPRFLRYELNNLLFSQKSK